MVTWRCRPHSWKMPGIYTITVDLKDITLPDTISRFLQYSCRNEEAFVNIQHPTHA